MTMKTCKLRFIAPSDWPEVMDIERNSFDYPWMEIEFRRLVRQEETTCLVAELDCEVIGYVVYSRMAGGIFINNIAVHEKYRRGGVASEMLRAVKGRIHGRWNYLFTYVSEYSLGAQLFLKSQGFSWTETIKDYFDEVEPKQVAYRMVWYPGDDGNE